MPSQPYLRSNPLTQELEQRFAAQRLRFDTPLSTNPVTTASGCLGRRFFYFRYRWNSVSLKVGYVNRRELGAFAHRDRVRALRTLRRGADLDVFTLVIAEAGLKPNLKGLDRYPSVVTRYAVINDVTDDEYGTVLTEERMAELFTELVEGLKPVRRVTRGHPARFFRKSFTHPMPEHDVVIVKRSKRRR